MHRRWWTFPATLLLCLPAAGPAAGQDAAPLDPTVGDVSPIDTSLRQLPAGLAPTNDFRMVFREGDGLVRTQGALRAVFPRSTYSLVNNRYVIPEVPPGTVFEIGPAFQLSTPEVAGPRPGRIDGRIAGRLPTMLVARETHGAAPPRPTLMQPLPIAVPAPVAPYNRMVVDAEYRADRLRALMAHAAEARRAQAAVGRSSSSSSPPAKP